MHAAKQFPEIPLTEKLKGLPAIFGIRLGEEPRYQVLASDYEREIRRYECLTLASVTEEGSFEQAAEAAFLRLAEYIFGAGGGHGEVAPLSALHSPRALEDREEALAMTVPVLQQRSRNGWTLSFVLPQRLSLATAPRPRDPGITLEHMPGRLVASLRFSGSVSEEIVHEKTTELTAWLDSNQTFRAVGTPYCALYDGPMTIPFLRRNEAQVPVQVRH